MCVISCTEKDTIERNIDFEFQQEGDHFLFLFARLPERDTLFREVRTSGDSVFMKNYCRAYPISEGVWFDGGSTSKALEHSIFYPDEDGQMRKISGKIIQVQNTGDKAPWGISIETEFNLSSTNKMSLTTSEIYAGDTTFLWSGKKLATLKFNLTQRVRDVNRLIPIETSEISTTGTTYYAKGLGFVGHYYYYNTPDGGKMLSSAWLMDIQRLD